MLQFIERYFGKGRAEEITFSDLTGFLQQGIEEHQTLEYKPRGLLVKQDDSIVNSNNPKDVVGFAALAKTVAGFANAEGGLLVLGVKERPEKYKGTTVKIRPGILSPLPMTITKEIIENQLMARIQYPVDGITIVPVRRSLRSKQTIFLIDVPQSARAPHRVNEFYYFQRYNFSTLEMKHYQIADLFGRRLSPDLTVCLQVSDGGCDDGETVSVLFVLKNNGSAVAKYVTCVCEVVGGNYSVKDASVWRRRGPRLCQYETGDRSVVYPEVSFETGIVDFHAEGPEPGPLLLDIGIYAEGMTGRRMRFTVSPRT